MKYTMTELKSELSNAILLTMKKFPEHAKQISDAARLANDIGREDLIIRIPPNGEPLCLHTRGWEIRFETRISDVLIAVGILPHLSGFHYVKQAIIEVFNDSKLLRNTNKTLYPKLAEQYGLTAAGIERDIRTAVAEIDKDQNRLANLDRELHIDFYKAGRRAPTSVEFIALVAERLKTEFPPESLRWSIL